MKVICINVSNRKKQNREKIFYTSLNIKQDCNDFWELTIPLDLLNKRVFENNKGIFRKLKGIFWDKKVISKMKISDKDKIYVLPKILEKDYETGTAMYLLKSHLMHLMNKAGIKSYTYSGNIKNNIYKYIEQELARQKIDFPNAKILLLYEESKNIDYSLIMEMIEKYKTIDIMCKNLDKILVEQNIEKINNALGSSIVVKNKITKKELKDAQYNVGICFDTNRNKFHLSNISIIDLSDNDMDKYDKYAILANKHKLYKKINNEYLTYMSKNYGRLKTLSLLCKTENLT